MYRLVPGFITATATLAVALTSCASDPSSDAEAGSKTEVSRSNDQTADEKAKRTVTLEGSLVRPYFLPSVEAFENSSFVTDVVIGTVTKTTTVVSEPGTEVFTKLSVRVEGARSAAPGSIITLRESGGVVPLADVAADFKGRLSNAELAADAETLVDYRVVGRPHTTRGQRLLFFVGGREGEPGGRFVAGQMMPTDEGTFEWVGTPGNPSWLKPMGQGRARQLFEIVQ